MANGGKRPGAGRKPKSKNKKTLEREAVLKFFNQRTMLAADRLWAAQAGLAMGSTYLYKVEKEWIKTGTKKNGEENGFYKKLKPELVTSQLEIENYLQGLTEEGDEDNDQDPAATYYFITTKDPDNRALDSLIDRSLGKTPSSIQATDEKGKVIPIMSINVVPLEVKKDD